MVFGTELSMIWAVLIAVAVFLYVALDGFDLGVGILFPFANDSKERDQMLHRTGLGHYLIFDGVLEPSFRGDRSRVYPRSAFLCPSRL